MIRGAWKVALAGALGGGINALLCYAGWPVVLEDGPFAWHAIPAGAVHGGVLALAAFASAIVLRNRHLAARLGAAVPVGWIAGFAAWIPLARSVGWEDSWRQSFTWVAEYQHWGSTYTPLLIFVFVALDYYLAVVLRLAGERRLTRHLFGGILAGTLGSLYWWIAMHHWYLSLLHGAIWGTLVGWATWSVCRTEYRIEGTQHS